ncbi:MAG: hypothetical protein Q7K29_01325 [Thermoleophilia bacterium]|nr:hypothetical protein [Thermoleophilia bacterium]
MNLFLDVSGQYVLCMGAASTFFSPQAVKIFVFALGFDDGKPRAAFATEKGSFEEVRMLPYSLPGEVSHRGHFLNLFKGFLVYQRFVIALRLDATPIDNANKEGIG